MRSFLLAPLLVVAALTATTGTAAAATSVPVTAPSGPTARPDTGPGAVSGPGGIGIRLMDVPTEAADDPRARVYIVDHLAPGAVIHRRVEVSNTTRTPVHVALYASAAGINEGAFTGADGRTQNDLSSWTKLAQSSLDLAPGAKVPDMVTVTVPADAPSGEQYAAIWAEITSASPGVSLVNRVGLRMYVDVGGGNPAPTSFTLDSLTALRGPDNRPAVTVQVHNDGGRALDLSGALSLSDGPGSLNAGPFPAQVGNTLAPGQSLSVAIPLDGKLPDGPWQASLTLRSGLTEKTAQARIQFPSGPGSSDPVSLGNLLGSPWVLLLLALLVAAAIVGVLVARRRSRRSTT